MQREMNEASAAGFELVGFSDYRYFCILRIETDPRPKEVSSSNTGDPGRLDAQRNDRWEDSSARVESGVGS